MENLETLNQAINAPQTQGDGQNIQGQGSLEQNIQEPQAGVLTLKNLQYGQRKKG